jgi:hypothetical protein
MCRQVPLTDSSALHTMQSCLPQFMGKGALPGPCVPTAGRKGAAAGGGGGTAD